MQVHRILETRVIKGRKYYLVQWLGQHRSASTWHSKSDIIKNHPTQLIHFRNNKVQFKNKSIGSSSLDQQIRQNSFGEDKVQGRHRKQRNQGSNVQTNTSFPSDQFKLVIKTDRKLESHWAYNDRVDQIISKTANAPIYSIFWSDGTQGEVSQCDLLERESIKLCQFWEKKLGVGKRKRR